MKEAKLWSTKSKCLSRKIGAVLVKDGHVIGTGYNGPPKSIPHCEWRDDSGNYVETVDKYGNWLDKEPVYECPRRRMGYGSGEGMEYCPAVHAEINPIMQAARFGISTIGSTLYCYCKTPCSNCAKEIVQAGIKRVVCLGKHITNTGYNFTLSEKLFELAGVKLDVITEDEVNNE
jgi:dCMP deaminase